MSDSIVRDATTWSALQKVADQAERLLMAGKAAEAVNTARRSYREVHIQHIASLPQRQRDDWDCIVRRAEAARSKRHG